MAETALMGKCKMIKLGIVNNRYASNTHPSSNHHRGLWQRRGKESNGMGKTLPRYYVPRLTMNRKMFHRLNKMSWLPFNDDTGLYVLIVNGVKFVIYEFRFWSSFQNSGLYIEGKTKISSITQVTVLKEKTQSL